MVYVKLNNPDQDHYLQAGTVLRVTGTDDGFVVAETLDGKNVVGVWDGDYDLLVPDKAVRDGFLTAVQWAINSDDQGELFGEDFINDDPDAGDIQDGYYAFIRWLKTVGVVSPEGNVVLPEEEQDA